MDLALNNLQSLIYHKTQRTKQTKPKYFATTSIFSINFAPLMTFLLPNSYVHISSVPFSINFHPPCNFPLRCPHFTFQNILPPPRYYPLIQPLFWFPTVLLSSCFVHISLTRLQLILNPLVTSRYPAHPTFFTNFFFRCSKFHIHSALHLTFYISTFLC